MTKTSKRELLQAIRPRYLRASKADKGRILDEFVATTGYHRKYAIRLLSHGAPWRPASRRRNSRVYTHAVAQALAEVWEICGRVCSRRLHPFLPDILEALEQHRELVLPADTKALLLRMSRATIDRLLKPAPLDSPTEGSARPSPAPCSRRQTGADLRRLG